MTNEISKKIFDLVGLVTNRPQEQEKEGKNKDLTLVGLPHPIKLGKVSNLKQYKSDGYGNTVEAYKIIGNDCIGLNKENYTKLSEVVNILIEQEPFSRYTNYRFLEDQLFDWVVLTYSEKKALKDPITYITEKFEEDLKTFNFYFKLRSVAIETPFKIGNAEFTFFSKDRLEAELKKFLEEFPNKTKDEFYQIFNGYEATPISKISVKGTKDKAKQLAKFEAFLAIDAIKCFLVRESINLQIKLLDLDLRFEEIQPFWSIYDTTSSKFDYSKVLEKNDGVIPIELHNEKIKELFSNGLDEVSNFLQTSGSDEVHQQIIGIIKQIGSYSSIRNLHERVVKIISLYETTFLPSKKGKGKGLTIIKSKVIPKLVASKDQEYFKKIFNEFYDVRDKFLHNGIEKRIDLNRLYYLQLLTTFLLRKLILLNHDHDVKSYSELMEYFEIKQAI